MHPLPGSNENVHPFFRAINAIQRVREDDTPCEIEKGLYLGSLRAANNKSALISYNVTHILTVAGHLPPSYPRDFVYKCITISDREDENISQYFDECFNFIEEAKRRGGVLVHCFAGRSRSVSILVAYLMKKHGMSLQQAMEHVRLKRPVASPNSGFMSQLRVFEMTLRDSEKRNAEEESDTARLIQNGESKKHEAVTMDEESLLIKMCETPRETEPRDTRDLWLQ